MSADHYTPCDYAQTNCPAWIEKAPRKRNAIWRRKMRSKDKQSRAAQNKNVFGFIESTRAGIVFFLLRVVVQVSLVD